MGHFRLKRVVNEFLEIKQFYLKVIMPLMVVKITIKEYALNPSTFFCVLLKLREPKE